MANTCLEPCNIGQICFQGKCVDVLSICGSFPCPEGETCVSGYCVRDLCPISCGTGKVCLGDFKDNTMRCVNPCNRTNCPCGYTCQLEEGYPMCIQDTRVSNGWLWSSGFIISIITIIILFIMLIVISRKPQYAKQTSYILIIVIGILLAEILTKVLT